MRETLMQGQLANCRCTRNMTLHLPAHGVAALLLNDDGPEPSYLNGSCAVYYQCSVRYVALVSRDSADLFQKWPNGTYISN